MISIEIRNDEIEHSYFLTLKDGQLFLENSDEESVVVSEMSLYQVIDEYFRVGL